MKQPCEDSNLGLGNMPWIFNYFFQYFIGYTINGLLKYNVKITQ